MKTVAFLFVSIMVVCAFAGCMGNDTPATTPKPATQSTPKDDEKPDEPKNEAIDMYYDDRVYVNKLVGVSLVDSVEIKNQVVTSKKLGTDTLDENVIIYEESTSRIIAVGTGTATLVADGKEYDVTVTPAPITLAVITGHSLGSGSKGDAAQSIVCEAGTAYNTTLSISTSTWLDKMLGSSIGYTEEDRIDNIDGLTKDATGTKGAPGVNSALAYEWHNLTGEKMWVINCAVGGSCINQGQPVATEQYMERTVKAMNLASEILKNEVEAGHYTYRTTIMFNFSSANFTYQNVVSDNDTLHRVWHDNLWKGFNKGVTVDIDGDGKIDGAYAMGYVPIWTPSMNDFNRDYHFVYNRAASDDYNRIFLASDLTRFLKTDENIAKNFPIHEYKIQSGNAITQPTTTSVLFPDGTHLCQAGYNAQGIHMANVLYSYLIEPAELKEITLINATDNLKGDIVGDTLTITTGKQYKLIITTDPVGICDLEITVEGNLTLEKPFYVSASTKGTGKIIIKRDGVVVKTVNVTVN